MTQRRKFYPGDMVRCVRSIIRNGAGMGRCVPGNNYIVGDSWRLSFSGDGTEDISIVESATWHPAEAFELIERGDSAVVDMSLMVLLMAKSKPELRKAA